MLNLSDKELDRLSQEAAQEHDPGDIFGPRSWDKLEPQLDRDLGRASPNPLKGVRRFPFYYAPAVLLLVAGVFYFAMQNYKTHHGEPSGSPPSVSTQPADAGSTHPISSSQDPENNKNSTSPVASADPADQALTHERSGTAANRDKTQNDASTAHSGVRPDKTSADPTNSSTGSAPGGNTRANSGGSATSSGDIPSDGSLTANNYPAKRNRKATASFRGGTGSRTRDGAAATTGASTVAGTTLAAGASLGAASPSNKTRQPYEPGFSTVHGLTPIKKSPVIDDSSLRAYTAKTPPPPVQPGKYKSLRINRSLQFGLSVAPDFSSVNSLAGDKPGSSIGITLDYQFARRWYLSTGLFLSRKNYAARSQDYHVPYDYYRTNNLHNVDYVKGSLNMLEIPINLRYDFSVTGNTLFFASAGISSYLLTNENCNYYYNMFGLESCRNFKYSNDGNSLFSSVNLSLGVETGISNSLSLLVAPYIKLPSRSIGFGQVQMNSVGINFALKFAPVISRKRK